MKNNIQWLAALSAALIAVASCGNPATDAGTSSELNGTDAGNTAVAGTAGESFVPKVLVESTPAEDQKAVDAIDSDHIEPSIRFVSKGKILPSTGNLTMLFTSVGYTKAEVRIRKVFANNILQYLQDDSSYNLSNVARQVADTTIVLGSPASSHVRLEKTYGLCLEELIKPDPGAIYYLEIRGREPVNEPAESYWESDWYFGDYSTYAQRSTSLLASDLGMIAKQGDRECCIFVTNLITGRPVGGVRVKIYDYVQQELGKGTTDKDGCVRFPLTGETPFFAVASSEKGYSYLRMRNGTSLSTSNFDVSGDEAQGGIKAYIFGERGVWRPGDTLHVSTVLMCDGIDLPQGHPVKAELRNPNGQVVQSLTARNEGRPIFSFPFVTAKDAPTGRWSVDVTVGTQIFSKTLRVETVKPNRMQVDINFPSRTLRTDAVGNVTVNWLYGAAGSGLKVDGELTLSPATTMFKGCEGFDFRDDARSFDPVTMSYPVMVTDASGQCTVTASSDISRKNAPGLLRAEYMFKAYEPSGEFSTGVNQYVISPFDTYVGMRTSKDRTEWGDEYIVAGKPHRFDLVSVDSAGNPVNAQLKVEIYHVDWSWWWNSASQIASYMSGRSKELVYSNTVNTSAGKGSFSYDWKEAPRGLFYIRATDVAGGHASSMLCEVYEDDYRSSAETDAATKLAVKLNKENYKVGETARLTIPSSRGSHVLVSIEKAGRILRSSWVEAGGGSSTEIGIPVTEDMLPNAYAFVTLVQPHSTTLNDAPIRMYGVSNINVEDAKSHLEPVVDVPAQVKPESRMRIRVSEKSGRAMSYVVAVVDEGLLGLTNFKTPDAWAGFYRKEALRVRTWDLYDDVIGAYGGRIEQLFAVGGDDEYTGAVKPAKADRFKPVVRFLGPFEIKAGRTATHYVDLPQYVGSLRTMVIASDGRAQGSCQKNVAVTKPVMVQASVPRTLATGELIKLPVTVMSLEDGVGKVKVSVRTSGSVSATGAREIELKSEKSGQQVVWFDLRTDDLAGVAKVSVTAESSSDKSSHDVEVDVLNPNPSVTRLVSAVIPAGSEKVLPVDIFGVDGSNSLSIELSAVPAINLAGRMKYLTSYPYGCVEQTVSAAFPQIYLPSMTECDKESAALCGRNVERAIARMQSFRLGDGSLSYWPGMSNVSPFGSAYALHFLQESAAAGYSVPSDLTKSLASYLAGMAGDTSVDGFVRAYASYVLALYGKPQRSAMNLLRENIKALSVNARWMLAAAYALDGKRKVADDICASLAYSDSSYGSYGSEDRNIAIALKTMLILGREEEALKLAVKLAGALNDASHYMSTQSTAWGLCAMADVASKSKDGINASVSDAKGSVRIGSAKCFVAKDLALPVKAGKTELKVKNNGSATIYAVASVTGIPQAGEEKAKSSGLTIETRYYSDGAEVNMESISQGMNITAVTTVANIGHDVRHLALTQRFPSGCEIVNDRVWTADSCLPAGLSYQDFRDDRVDSFFDLRAGSSVSVSISLVASCPGRFYLPAVSCEAMYDASVSASVPGRWIEIKQN